MPAEVLALVPRGARVIADLTIGLGGHAEAILERVGGDAVLLAFDRDVDNLDLARRRLERLSNRITYIHDSFANLDRLGEAYRGGVDFALLDLGVSSRHLDGAGRGFSFTHLDEPLDLRYDATSGVPVSSRLARTTVSELAAVFRKYGELKQASAIARAVGEAQAAKPLTRVGDLVAVLDRFARRDRRHKFLAKCWQALRIWHNSELEELQVCLTGVVDFLKPDGVVAVISFHSLEDRMVKDFFLRQENPCICPPRLPVCVCGRKARLRRISKRPQLPTAAEIAGNPRARSARLRAARRLFDS
jgi:16S rRNA (cytosine1402-N4)-methyltransferase